MRSSGRLGRKTASGHSPVAKGMLYVLLAVMSLPFVYPTLWMVFSAFKPTGEIFRQPPALLPDEWTLQGVGRIFTATPFAIQYFNSLYISVVITVFVIVFSGLAGYAFARIQFPFSSALFLMLVSGLMIPNEITIIPIFQWVNRLGLIDTHWPLIVPSIIGPTSIISVFIFRQYFLSLPLELEEAARLDGLGRLRIFLRIAFPLATPAVSAVAIMTFLRAFNMYFEPLVYLRTPERFTAGLGLTRYSDAYGEPLWNTQIGATALTVIPILIVFIFAQRQFVEGLSRTGLKG